MIPDAFFHLPSGTVRFWIEVDGQAIGASIGKEVLHYRFHANQRDDEPLQTYLAHAPELEAAVRRRVAAGSLEPVMLRDADVQQRRPG